MQLGLHLVSDIAETLRHLYSRPLLSVLGFLTHSAMRFHPRLHDPQ